MENQKAMPFSMPMFREWVPKRIQPWIYIAQVICIQFSCGVYLGAMEAVRGTTALQLEDAPLCRFGRHGGVVSDAVSDEVPLHEPTAAHHIGGRDCGVQFYHYADDEHGYSAAGLFFGGRGEDTRHV